MYDAIYIILQMLFIGPLKYRNSDLLQTIKVLKMAACEPVAIAIGVPYDKLGYDDNYINK